MKKLKQKYWNSCMDKEKKIADVLQILKLLGLPRAQQNERSALCLLALLNLTAEKTWLQVENPLIGITPMMEFARNFYNKEYAPNTREIFRRQTMHQFIEAGIALYNPDEPLRPVNSPQAVYQIAPDVLTLLMSYETKLWEANLAAYLLDNPGLAKRYAKEREQNQLPVKIAPNQEITLSPGEHSELIKVIIESFGPRHVPGGILIYAGDTGKKWSYFDELALANLSVTVDFHGKMPDVILYYPEKHWLILIEAVTSHGPVDAKRHEELKRLFQNASAGLVFVTAFHSKSKMAKYLSEISWETEVWVADAPSHLIHFNGVRFLGPYD